MPTFALDFTGEKQLVRALKQLPDKMQRSVQRSAMRKTLQEVHTNMLLNLSGRVVQEDTGRYVSAMERQKVRALRAKDKSVLISGIAMPTRSEIGLDSGTRGYYPAVLEYGSQKRGIRSFAPIRRAVDEFNNVYMRIMRSEAGKAIERQMKKLLRTAA